MAETPAQKNIVALHQPEIPANTGNIARTCVLTATALHLIKPLGYSLSDKHLKRAGLDYWDELDLTIWKDEAVFFEFMEHKAEQGYQLVYATSKAEHHLGSLQVTAPCILLLGKETAGLPETILQKHPERCVRIPMLARGRSLNLSNAAAVLLYEILRQQGFAHLV